MATSTASVEATTAHGRPIRYGRAAKIRIVVLSTVMCILLVALWYDYEVARGGVDRAFDTIALLNASNNQASAFAATTQKDVRRALQRRPSRIFQEGPFTIETYAWPAGVPFEFEGLYSETPTVTHRTHDYYAVYLGTRLATHYKFYLPLEEVRRRFSPTRVAKAAAARVVADDRATYEQARTYYRLMDEYHQQMAEAGANSDDIEPPPRHPTVEDFQQQSLETEAAQDSSPTDEPAR